MRFGPRPVREVVGAVLAHTVRLESGRTLRKGRVLDEDDVSALVEDGVSEVPVARLEDGDVGEDEAAELVARALAGSGLRVAGTRTGRCNLLAGRRGLLCVDATAVHRVNGVDEGLTVATLAPWRPVEEGEVVATVKIVPFGMPRSRLDEAAALAGVGAPALTVAPYRIGRAGLVLTRTPGLPEGAVEQAATTLRNRLADLECAVAAEVRCDHDAEAVRGAVESLAARDLGLVILLGASATCDRDDVIPEGIRRAGGSVERLGMPVDPGHLLLVARRGDLPVLVAPGCARGPEPSGFDAVLRRVCAGRVPSAAEISEMGVGGLLRDISARPGGRRDRSAESSKRRLVSAVVLAAGASRRMEAANKLLMRVEGRPMVARVVDALLGSSVEGIVVVTGHEAEAVERALGDRPVRCVRNPGADGGMSTSLRTGLAELADEAEAALVCLGDMPWVTPGHVEALIHAFDPERGREICVPTHGGKRGNPVLWGSRFFSEMQGLSGDVGARGLLAEHGNRVVEVEMDDVGVLLDVDTREAARELGLLEPGDGEE